MQLDAVIIQGAAIEDEAAQEVAVGEGEEADEQVPLKFAKGKSLPQGYIS